MGRQFIAFATLGLNRRMKLGSIESSLKCRKLSHLSRELVHVNLPLRHPRRTIWHVIPTILWASIIKHFLTGWICQLIRLSNLTDGLFFGRRSSLASSSVASVLTSAAKFHQGYIFSSSPITIIMTPLSSILTALPTPNLTQSYYQYSVAASYLGGGPVSAASKDFFMASMAASC